MYKVTYSIYVTTPRVHISVGKETKSKLTTSGARNSGVPTETLSFSRGLYLQEKRADGDREYTNNLIDQALKPSFFKIHFMM